MPSKRSARVAHAMPGRIRLRLTEPLDDSERREFESDLKISPQVKKVQVRGTSVVIEHLGSDEHPWSLLEKWFPKLVRISDTIDMSVARLTETPEVNKLVPLAFLGFGLYKYVRDGVFMAGESAFAITYIAFDLYWKFQQENVTRKIQKGLSGGQSSKVDEQAA